jgi:hypothetical protein
MSSSMLSPIGNKQEETLKNTRIQYTWSDYYITENNLLIILCITSSRDIIYKTTVHSSEPRHFMGTRKDIIQAQNHLLSQQDHLHKVCLGTPVCKCKQLTCQGPIIVIVSKPLCLAMITVYMCVVCELQLNFYLLKLHMSIILGLRMKPAIDVDICDCNRWKFSIMVFVSSKLRTRGTV